MIMTALLCALLFLMLPGPALAEPGGPSGLPRVAYLPVLHRPAAAPVVAPCPSTSAARFEAVPHDGTALDHPSELHGDLNLALRGWQPVSTRLGLVVYGGPAPDPDAPQLAGLFADGRLPAFTAAYQVRDWNWSCGAHGCPGSVLTRWPVTLLGMATKPGEAIRIPTRSQDIYQGVYRAMVLYASEQRITLVYTRENFVGGGYAVHLEGVCVDPALLQLYRQLDAAGRPQLPALRNGQALGTAQGASIAVAVRDRGEFMDPRSAYDWWKGKPVPADAPLLARPPADPMVR